MTITRIMLNRRIPFGTILFALLVVFIGCTEVNDESTYDHSLHSKVTELRSVIDEKDLFITSLSQELSAINSFLDEISLTQMDSFFLVDSLYDPQRKLAYFDSLLTLSDEKIKVLEEQAETAKTDGEANLLNTVVRDLRQTLEEKERLIIKLSTENSSLRTENLYLNDSLTVKVEVLGQLEQEVRAQEAKLKELKLTYEADQKDFRNERTRLQQDLEKAKGRINTEKALSYFQIAKDLLDQYDSTNTGILQAGKKKMKQDLLSNAYGYFREACILGHEESSQYIRKLLTDKTYSKDLSINQTGASLTKCGI